MKNFDDRIKKSLEDNINISHEEKQEIWNNIERELFAKQSKGELKMKRSKKRSYQGLVVAAAVLIVAIGVQTEMGHAIIDQIKEFFAPQKNIVQEIEGNKEKTDINLQTPSSTDYVIYVDEERYVFVDGEESDMITMKNPPVGNYPEVSMKIKQVINKTPEDVIKDLETSISEEYNTFHKPEEIREPIVGWTLMGLKGQNWDSEVIKIYVLSNGKQGSFIITQKYFLEAAEGHGVRFDEMVKEFHLIDETIEK